MSHQLLAMEAGVKGFEYKSLPGTRRDVKIQEAMQKSLQNIDKNIQATEPTIAANFV